MDKDREKTFKIILKQLEGVLAKKYYGEEYIGRLKDLVDIMSKAYDEGYWQGCYDRHYGLNEGAI